MSLYLCVLKLKFYDCFHRQAVAVQSEAADDTPACGTDHAVVAILLALMDVRDVYLDDGGLQRADAVAQGDGCMRVGTGVEHDAVVGEPYLLHLVDELSLHIALVVLDVDVGIALLQFG